MSKKGSTHTAQSGLENFTELLGSLLQTHQGLAGFAACLSDSDLIEELQHAIGCLENDLPIIPPDGLQEEARIELTDRNWRRLLSCLSRRESVPAELRAEDLPQRDLEAIAVGTLWGCLLVREYERRCGPARDLRLTQQSYIH